MNRYTPLAMGACVIALTACSQSAPSSTTVASLPSASAPVLSPVPAGLTVPKVPFNHQPCQSLTQDEQRTLEQKAWGYSLPVAGKPDRAPAQLQFDNVCFYHDFNVGYMAKLDYDGNRNGNHSTEHPDPTDLPGAFYDKQGGLWFAKNGYYVVIARGGKMREMAAHQIAGKL